MGLAHRLDHKPAQMSGGQQQRVAIARAIAQAPPIILADEPTGNLDSNSTKEIMQILRELHSEGRTVILITHDNEIAEQADRVIKIRDGKIVSDTKQLAVPKLETVCQEIENQEQENRKLVIATDEETIQENIMEDTDNA